MKSLDDENASVSYIHHSPSAVREIHDTDSILSLVGKLKFNVDENKKEQFFNEIEFVLIAGSKKEENEYQGLVEFFLRHLSPQGTVCY